MLHFTNSIYWRTIRRLSVKVNSWSVIQALGEEVRPVQLRISTSVGMRGGSLCGPTLYYLKDCRHRRVLLKIDMYNAFNSLRRDSFLSVAHVRTPGLYSLLWQAYSSMESSMKCRTYFFSSVIQFCLFQLTNYKLSEKFGMHSLSLQHKTASGNVGTASVTTALKQQRRISGDFILILDKIYLQESEEYFGRDIFRTNEDRDLYKGMLCFVIIGLKNSIPCVIKSVPENELSDQFIKDPLIECLKILHGLKIYCSRICL